MIANGSFAFMMLKDGRAVFEKYYTGTQPTTVFNLGEASSLVSNIMAAIAIEEGLVDLDTPITQYIGTGFSNATPAQEQQITLEHLLRGTTGLSADLNFVTAPGASWSSSLALHNLLVRAISSPVEYNNDPNFALIIQGLFFPSPPHPGGAWITTDGLFNYNTDLRGAARTALLWMANGDWDGQSIIEDKGFIQSAITADGNPNPSYGYNFWLNGQSNFSLPESPNNSVSGTFNPNGFDETYSAIGTSGLFIDILPSQGIVVVRLGRDLRGDTQVSLDLYRDYWEQLSALACSLSSTQEVIVNENAAFPNPFSENIQISGDEMPDFVRLYDIYGKLVVNEVSTFEINTASLPKGIYVLEIGRDGLRETKKMLKH